MQDAAIDLHALAPRDDVAEAERRAEAAGSEGDVVDRGSAAHLGRALVVLDRHGVLGRRAQRQCSHEPSG